MSNLAQFHKIPKSLKNIRTLSSKFSIKACESCLYDAWTKTHDLVLIKKPKNIKNPKFWKVQKFLKKCMKTCNMIKKKGQRCLTLGLGRIPLKLWPRKRQFFFFFLIEGIKRGFKEIDKKFLEKSDLIPICFWKLKSDWSRGIGQGSKCTWRKVRLVERNRERIEWT